VSEPGPAADESGGVTEAESEFAQNTFQSMFDLFWDPEIERRGGLEATGPLRKALAIMRTGQPVEILLNDEADLVASVNVAGPQHACSVGRERPAIQAAHACAELVVTSIMYLTDEAPVSGRRSPHGKRKHWLNMHTHLGNAPVRFHETLVRLGELRPWARYGEERRAPASGEVGGLVDVLREMIEHAAARVGDPLSEIDDLDESEIRNDRQSGDRRREDDARPAS
jgi:hypothetical protein